jgi:hypothetical protein
LCYLSQPVSPTTPQDDEDAEPSNDDSSGWETEEDEEMDVESAVAKARAAAEAISANSGKAAAKPSSKSKVRRMCMWFHAWHESMSAAHSLLLYMKAKVVD